MLFSKHSVHTHKYCVLRIQYPIRYAMQKMRPPNPRPTSPGSRQLTALVQTFICSLQVSALVLSCSIKFCSSSYRLFSRPMSSFVLNTTISAPHDGPISEICFSPSSQNSTTLVSVSLDGHFKAWQLTQPDPSDGKQSGPGRSRRRFFTFGSGS